MVNIARTKHVHIPRIGTSEIQLSNLGTDGMVFVGSKLGLDLTNVIREL